MALFGKEKPELEKPEEDAAAAGSEDKGKRPGTSGTEMLLVSTRREASQKLQRAQRAERVYKSKKRAGAARENLQASRGHFRASARHLRDGFATLFRAVGALPYVFSQDKEERRRRKAQAARKRLEERLARETEDAGPEPEAEKPKES